MTAEHTSEKLAPIKVPCEGSNLVGHAWFAETIGECVLCQMCGGTFGAVVGHPDQVPLHDRIDIIAMITRGDFDNDIANAHRECCCSVEGGKAYCGAGWDDPIGGDPVTASTFTSTPGGEG